MQRKGPLPGKIFARCILRRRFAGHFGCMARISCQSQLVLDAWRANLARKGRFSRPRPLSGCMERKTCHGLPPGNASGRNLAIARRPGTHFTGILPSVSARNATAPCASTSCVAAPSMLAPNAPPCPTCPSLMPPRRPPQRRDAMRRTRRFCRCWKSKLRVTGVNEVKRTTCFGLSAIVPLTY